jgi:hypothetical protein
MIMIRHLDIVAAAAVAGLLTIFVWPAIRAFVGVAEAVIAFGAAVAGA